MVASTEILEHKESSRIKVAGIFQPFKAIGYVTSDVPVCVQARGQANFITSAVGSTFNIWDGQNLRLRITGPPYSKPITALAVFRDSTFAASGSTIFVAERAQQRKTIEVEDGAAIKSLTVVGHLLFVICDDNMLRIWDAITLEFHNEIEFPATFRLSVIVHPSTYVNKILCGSEQGGLRLYNFRTMKCIHEFKSFDASVAFMCQSPSIDVIAVGLANGDIILHNVRVDERLMEFKQEEKVTAIAFNPNEPYMMVTANVAGDLSIWDLDKRHIIHVMRGIHSGAIHTAVFYAGQGVLLTAGADNTIKQWIFDSLSDIPRLLRSRSGHYQPPAFIRHYSSDPSAILSAGDDHTLRTFHTIRDTQNLEISQGPKNPHENTQISRITQFDTTPNETHTWSNAISAHLKGGVARTWDTKHKKIGHHSFPSTDDSPVKCVAMSVCGNFGFVGSALGTVDMYNMQSGMLRKTFKGKHGHTKAIMGIVSDKYNKILVTASLDGTLKFWDFKTSRHISTLSLPSAPSRIILHRDSSLLAVSSDDLCIRIVDLESLRTVREFWGHQNRITDLTFSPDGRMLLSSSLDSTIRTWDLSSGYMIDAFRTDSVPRSVTMSPTGDFLATAHAGHVGIFLWLNRSLFEKVSLRNLSEEDIIDLSLPLAPHETKPDIADEADDDQMVPDEGSEDVAAESTLGDASIISLSSHNFSKWQTFLNLETIRKRNKAKVLDSKPKRAPFLLSMLVDRPEKQKEIKEKEEANAPKPASGNGGRIIKSDLSSLLSAPQSELSRLLSLAQTDSDYADVWVHLKGLSPSELHLQLSLLTTQDMLYFLEAATWKLQGRTDFEVVEACLNGFLQVHRYDLSETLEAQVDELLSDLKRLQKQVWEALEKEFEFGLALIEFVRA
ncbi:WD40-repeat-containing domain protein [Gaertneriomyces semiglobifer]|nr:WD40-repeat-containing domain protein [Gaertneriomyces semiglobifer]